MKEKILAEKNIKLKIKNNLKYKIFVAGHKGMVGSSLIKNLKKQKAAKGCGFDCTEGGTWTNNQNLKDLSFLTNLL